MPPHTCYSSSKQGLYSIFKMLLYLLPGCSTQDKFVNEQLYFAFLSHFLLGSRQVVLYCIMFCLLSWVWLLLKSRWHPTWLCSYSYYMPPRPDSLFEPSPASLLESKLKTYAITILWHSKMLTFTHVTYISTRRH